MFTADSKNLLSSGPEPIVRFWDVEQGKETGQLDTRISHVRALALTADDKTLIVGGQDKTLKIFDLETRKQVAVLWNGADSKMLDMDALPASTPEKADEPGSHPSILLLVLALTTPLTIALIAWILVRRGRTVRQTLERAPAAQPAVEQEPEAARICFDLYRLWDETQGEGSTGRQEGQMFPVLRGSVRSLDSRGRNKLMPAKIRTLRDLMRRNINRKSQDRIVKQLNPQFGALDMIRHVVSRRNDLYAPDQGRNTRERPTWPAP